MVKGVIMSNKHPTNTYTETIKFNSCESTKFETISTCLDDTGRLLFVKINLRNVLCNSSLSVGVILYVHDIIKGYKIRKVIVKCPCCSCFDCANIELDEFCFVLPDKDLCLEEEISIRVIAHYTDIC